MGNDTLKQKDNFRDIIDVYLTKWKFILLCVFASLVLSLIYLRYATYEYQANATIKIKDDKSKTKLPEISALQNYGLFKTDLNTVIDEIEVLKSRAIITEVVKDLKLNIKYFVEGRVKAEEIYTNPPLNINFSATDSVLHKVDTTFNIRINSSTDFLFRGIDKDDKSFIKNNKKVKKNGVIYNFGESVKTGFGDIIITPNIGQYATKIGSNIKIQIIPLDAVSGAVSYTHLTLPTIQL